MEDKTPEDVAFEKLMKRSRSAYDKAMPQADTTFETLPYKPGSDKEMEAKPLGRGRMDGSLDDLGRVKRKKSDITPLAKGGSVSSASKRADGIAQRGKTKGTTIIMCGGGYMKGK